MDLAMWLWTPFAVDKRTQMTRQKKNVKTAADVQQKKWVTVKNAYTYSKNTIRILEVNFYENKIVKIQLVFISFSGFEE